MLRKMAEKGKLDEEVRKVNTYEPEECEGQTIMPAKSGIGMFKKRGKNKTTK